MTTVFVTAAERHATPRHRALPCTLLLASLCGCSTFVTATPINPAPRPLVPREPASVLVLATTPPSEPHVDVALLQVEQQQGRTRQGLPIMIQRLREKAAELGCDAVFVKNSSSYQGVDLDPNGRELLASCIVFTPPDATRQGTSEVADGEQRIVPPRGQGQR